VLRGARCAARLLEVRDQRLEVRVVVMERASPVEDAERRADAADLGLELRDAQLERCLSCRSIVAPAAAQGGYAESKDARRRDDEGETHPDGQYDGRLAVSRRFRSWSCQ
jgi:hypothetical protein